MQTLDNPGVALVTVPLTDSNFLTWSRSIQRALAAKNKLGFINETLSEPSNEPDRSKWRQADEINSMSKEITKTFVHYTSARKLWVDLEEQFGESNGPQIYHVQREISSICIIAVGKSVCGYVL